MFESRIALQEFSEKIRKINDQICQYIYGQEEFIHQLILAIIADGHVLIEGVPGVAKTQTAKLLAHSIDASFHRIQFTPDLMPSDILGTSVFNMKTSEFEFNKGPIFAQIILADEINRSPAKTQAALFECMEERQVTVDGKTHSLGKIFHVFATQNPIEQEGTYRLPEAQLDRFIFKINVSYPSQEAEIMMLQRIHEGKHLNAASTKIEKILNAEHILMLKEKINEVRIEEGLFKYISEVVRKTRQHPSIYLGASPRAGINIMKASKAHALTQGRDFITPDDIKYVAIPVLRHRIQLTPDKEMEGIQPEQVITQILESTEVPK
ncbi:MAG: MoxR family ATPase [Bacteroidia bacterium]|nr:MoxR family ATPase [Bacteroidia bacterium]